MKPQDASAALLYFLQGLEAHGVSTTGLVELSAGDLRQAIANAETVDAALRVSAPEPPEPPAKPDKPYRPEKP